MEIASRYLFFLLLSLSRGIDIQVSTTLGKIRGQRIPFNYSDNLVSISTTIDTFYSIPYAEPPIGEYRFYKTVPKEPWQGIWDATYKRPICWQVASNISQDEDCLHLNIWTPSTEVGLSTFQTKSHQSYVNLQLIDLVHSRWFYSNICGGSSISTSIK